MRKAKARSLKMRLFSAQVMHGARRHHGRDVAGDEAGAGQFGQRHHGVNLAAAFLVVVGRRLGQHDLDLGVMRQVVERGDDVPAVHLALVDLLRAVIEAGGVAQAHGIGGGEEPEGGMRADDAVLVEQRQLAVDLEHALDDEHHVRAAGVVFVEHQRGRMLQRPGQQAFAEFRHLHAVAQHDRVLADQVDAADMAVQIDADAGPVEPRGDLLDMRRLAGAVIALDQHAPVEGEARQDRQRGVAVEAVGLVDIGHVVARPREGRDLHVGIDAEGLPDRDGDVGPVEIVGGRSGVLCRCHERAACRTL